jgi:hypothetical protein
MKNFAWVPASYDASTLELLLKKKRKTKNIFKRRDARMHLMSIAAVPLQW